MFHPNATLLRESISKAARPQVFARKLDRFFPTPSRTVASTLKTLLLPHANIAAARAAAISTETANDHPRNR
jgi:hypothetical protein